MFMQLLHFSFSRKGSLRMARIELADKVIDSAGKILLICSTIFPLFSLSGEGVRLTRFDPPAG